MQHDESSLLTLSDWQRAVGAGASVRAMLQARQFRLAPRAAGSSQDAAWIHRTDAAALEVRLRELDALAVAHASPSTLLAAYPLYGVPFAVKDNIDVAGVTTTAACPAWGQAQGPAGASATVVQRLLDAGAVLMGKTNLDQFATGLVGTRSPYGVPASTWAADRVSGGSSSGSAVVVARGDVVFALGTDTAGSGRVPAGFNHLVGLKPTPGRVSTAGVLPACRSLDCVSVLALTVEDAAAVLALMEGPDTADDYSAFALGAVTLPVRPRLGVPRAPLLDAACGYPGAWRQALDQARALGAEVVELDFEPLHEVAQLLYSGPWVAERYAVVQTLLERQPQALDATVATVISQATRHMAVDAFRAQYALRRYQAQLAPLWSQVDALLVPTAPRHPSLADLAADPVGANALLGTYTNFVNLLGWSALALPASVTDRGLPFGVTFIGPAQADAALARWGQRWQAQVAQPLGATGRAWVAPDTALPWPATRATLPIAVVGAHLSGLPLNSQLTERGATLAAATHTAPLYRLFELPGTTPRKPGMVRCGPGGHAIAVEVWDMPVEHVGSFLALIPQPLGLGTLELADGRRVHGFVCEPIALEGARDISHHGGWRAHLAVT